MWSCSQDLHYQLTTGASFDKDLGLDSLDAVEVVMAVEEVFTCLLSVPGY